MDLHPAMCSRLDPSIRSRHLMVGLPPMSCEDENPATGKWSGEALRRSE